MGKRIILHGVAPIVFAASDCVCTMPRRFFRRFAESLDLFTPPVTLPPTQLLAL